MSDAMFEDVLPNLRRGLRVRRRGWNESIHHVSIYRLTGRPSFVLSHREGEVRHWTPSTQDLFATDWVVMK